MSYSPACIFGLIATGRGIPILRHDWLTLSGRFELVRFVVSTLSWQPDGIGSVRVYPSDYLYSSFNALTALLFGTQISVFIFVTVAGIVCIYGARSLAALEFNDGWASFALSLFALFNPWVYVKLIEGHVVMIASYGAFMGLVAELWRERPRWTTSALLMAPMAQLQFFVLGIAACACAALFRRERMALFPIACGIVFTMPSIVGFMFDGSSVLATPYNLDWQVSQSIGTVDAAALAGFFTHYLRGFPPIAFDAVWSFAALALIGVFARSRRRTYVLLIVGFVAWALSTGTKGPSAAIYSALVRSFPPIELYRELYDVLGIVAAVYVAVAAVATARFKTLGRVALVPAFVLLACWFVSPPSSWWVERSELPKLTIDAPPNSRFALYPDIGPLEFASGSGTDPDAYARSNNVTPLNGSAVAYPASVALRQYASTGDANELRALGVSRIYDRPWLRSDIGAAAQVSSLATSPGPTTISHAARSIVAEPELSLLDQLSVTANLPAIGSGQIFFGDIAGRRGADLPPAWAGYERVEPESAGRTALHASDDWVDVRDAFLAQPNLGQALGGALTTSASAVLPIPGEGALLALVRGRLKAVDGRTISHSTNSYAWIDVPAGTTGLMCEGECVIAARGVPPPIGRASEPQYVALPFAAPVPWFAWTTVPKRPNETVLRYLVGYDRGMIAIDSSRELSHVRIESVFNGWVVPAHEGDLHVLIIDTVSAVQFVLEFLGIGLLVTLAYLVARNVDTRATGLS